MAFNQVGLAPDNIPERVAQRKIVEELLDAIVEHSHISFANLRDAGFQERFETARCRVAERTDSRRPAVAGRP
jgi:hypothetical protein